jgi:hypothetical protein
MPPIVSRLKIIASSRIGFRECLDDEQAKKILMREHLVQSEPALIVG